MDSDNDNDFQLLPRFGEGYRFSFVVCLENFAAADFEGDITHHSASYCKCNDHCSNSSSSIHLPLIIATCL